jgi:hypothetical protein
MVKVAPYSGLAGQQVYYFHFISFSLCPSDIHPHQDLRPVLAGTACADDGHYCVILSLPVRVFLIHIYSDIRSLISCSASLRKSSPPLHLKVQGVYGGLYFFFYRIKRLEGIFYN